MESEESAAGTLRPLPYPGLFRIEAEPTSIRRGEACLARKRRPYHDGFGFAAGGQNPQKNTTKKTDVGGRPFLCVRMCGHCPAHMHRRIRQAKRRRKTERLPEWRRRRRSRTQRKSTPLLMEFLKNRPRDALANLFFWPQYFTASFFFEAQAQGRGLQKGRFESVCSLEAPLLHSPYHTPKPGVLQEVSMYNPYDIFVEYLFNLPKSALIPPVPGTGAESPTASGPAARLRRRSRGWPFRG